MCDGVTILDVCVGLALSAVKDTKEVAFEVGCSIDRDRVTISKVGLSRSKYGKGGGDGIGFFEEGEDMGVWEISKGKSGGRYSIQLS